MKCHLKAKLTVLIVILIFGFVFSASSSTKTQTTCEKMLKAYGSKIALPEEVGRFFNGERLNLIFKMNKGSDISVNGQVMKNAIGNIKCGSKGMSDYDVTLTEEAAKSLSKSDTPAKTFVSHMKKGEIKIKANGMMQAFKLKIAEMMMATQK